MLTDRAFRKKLDEKLPASHRVGWEQPDAREYEVVYAIVEASGRALVEALPFFSRLTLRNAARQLVAVGFSVAAVGVGVARVSAEASSVELSVAPMGGRAVRVLSSRCS